MPGICCTSVRSSDSGTPPGTGVSATISCNCAKSRASSSSEKNCRSTPSADCKRSSTATLNGRSLFSSWFT